MREPIRILVVDDEPVIREVLVGALTDEGYACLSSDNVDQELGLIEQDGFELVLADIKMPGRDGMELLTEVRKSRPDLGVVMVTAVIDLSLAVEAMRMGAHDYVTKPFNNEEVKLRVARALERQRLIVENRGYQKSLERLVTDRTTELENRVRELDALNSLFQHYLSEERDTTEQFDGIARSIINLADQLREVLDASGTQRVAREST